MQQCGSYSKDFYVKLSVTEETRYCLLFGWSLIMSILSVKYVWLLYLCNHTWNRLCFTYDLRYLLKSVKYVEGFSYRDIDQNIKHRKTKLRVYLYMQFSQEEIRLNQLFKSLYQRSTFLPFC